MDHIINTQQEEMTWSEQDPTGSKYWIFFIVFVSFLYFSFSDFTDLSLDRNNSKYQYVDYLTVK